MMVASARNRWWLTGAMKMLLELGNTPRPTHAWASTSYLLVRVRGFRCCTSPERNWLTVVLGRDVLDTHCLLSLVSFCSCIFPRYEYSSIREERWAGLFYVICISEIVKEMPDGMTAPEANSLGNSDKPKKVVPLKARLGSPGLQQMAVLLIDIKTTTTQTNKKTMAVWNPSSFSLPGRLA